MIVPPAAAERPLLDIYLAFVGVGPVWLFNLQNKRKGGGGDGQPCIENRISIYFIVYFDVFA
jgi:hypothetical protein